MGPVGHYVILAGRGEMVDRSDLVGPHNSTEQSVFLGLDVDQVEHVSANIVHPGVKMYRNQPVTDGPAGPDRTRRPVGTDGMHAVHDADRPTAGGPVGRLFNLDPLGPSRMPSLDELNQPLAMGQLGTEGIHAVNDSDPVGWCWDCVDRLVWGYRVSCLVTIVTKNRSLGIDLFTEERRVYASGLGLVGDPVRPYDVIPLYMWMKENFKGGLNKVMLMNKAPVDSRYHQRGGDNRQVRRTRASVNNRPIRVWGRFGCLYSPVHDADWSDVLSVAVSPVGKDVWIEYIGDGFSQCQIICCHAIDRTTRSLHASSYLQ